MEARYVTASVLIHKDRIPITAGVAGGSARPDSRVTWENVPWTARRDIPIASMTVSISPKILTIAARAVHHALRDGTAAMGNARIPKTMHPVAGAVAINVKPIKTRSVLTDYAVVNQECLFVIPLPVAQMS